MRSFIIRFVAIGAIISLSACASAPRPSENYLDAGARQHIKTVDAVLITKQDRIAADIKKNSPLTQLSALSGIPILPAFLDVGVAGVRSINANKMAKPMREKLDGHDYAFEFKKHVEQSLEGTTLDGIEDFEIVRRDYPGLRGQLIEESYADAVLVVDMKYGFTPNFGTLYVYSLAMLFPNRPELKRFQESPGDDRVLEFSDNIYRNQYAVGISTKTKDGKASENAAVWAKMSEEQLVEVLELAGRNLSSTIANDIGIDDVESDLDLIPEGYVLNTKFDNLNRKFSEIRSLDSIFETPIDNDDVVSDADIIDEQGIESENKPAIDTGLNESIGAEIDVSVDDVKTSS